MHRLHNAQKKKDKRTHNDLQNTTQKTKKIEQHETRGELRCSGRVISSAPPVAPVVLL